MRIWLNLKTPGVIDLFRVPKPGAALLPIAGPPSADKPVILPLFFWDYGPTSPVNGPGPDSAIATNCDRLELFVDGTHLATALPDTGRSYPNLACPPAFADLSGSRPAPPRAARAAHRRLRGHHAGGHGDDGLRPGPGPAGG